MGYYDYYSILHLKYYPGFYDTLKALVTSAFPKSVYYEGHHVVNFIVGLSGLIALKKFVKIIFNKKISDIFFILSFFTPIFFGHLGFNPKDTIIAAANFWILYYTIKYQIQRKKEEIKAEHPIDNKTILKLLSTKSK